MRVLSVIKANLVFQVKQLTKFFIRKMKVKMCIYNYSCDKKRNKWFKKVLATFRQV